MKFFLSILFLLLSLQLFSQNKFDLDVLAGYSRPLLETYGKDNLELAQTEDLMLISGKRLIISPNLGTNKGYSIQLTLKYNFSGMPYIKPAFNIGYNQLYSSYTGPADDYGVRFQTFSIGVGTEIFVLPKARFSPSIMGLLRLNFVGGESYYHAGLDFFKVAARYGFTASIRLNYRTSKKISIFSAFNYTYDNAWNKQNSEESQYDAHTIPFRDKKSSTNGLTSDRRVVYASYLLGITIHLW